MSRPVAPGSRSATIELPVAPTKDEAPLPAAVSGAIPRSATARSPLGLPKVSRIRF